MELLKLSFSIIFIMASYPEGMFNTETGTEINFGLPNDVKPKHYWIQLKVDVENNVFHGTTNISFFVYKQTDKISLYAKNLNIIHPTMVESVATNTTNRKHIITSLRYIYKTGILSYFVNPDVLSPGWYKLNIKFTGNISDIPYQYGFFKSSYTNVEGDREWFVTTHDWAIAIQQLFPCWDEPGFHVIFDIIVEHHKKYTALSNTPSSKNVYVNDDIVQTHFVFTSAISAYFITIVLCNLSNLTKFENVNLEGRFQIVDDLIFADDVIKNITRYFEDEWNQSNVFIEQQHFTDPNFRDDAQWEFVFYREEDIIYNKIIDPIARKVEVARLIGHKIGLQWLKSINSSLSLWLNEVIATVLFTSDVIDKIIPNSRVSDLFEVQILQESLYLDQLMTNLVTLENNFTDINSDVSFFYYIKAPALLYSLQRMLSNNVFRRGIKLYIKKQSPSLNDFLAAMQSAYDIETVPSQKFNIMEIMHSWIKQNHYPVLNAEIYSDRIRVSIEDVSETWKCPVTLTKLSCMNFDTLNTTLIQSGRNFFHHYPVSKDELIIINLEQIGYYRVMYSIENWQRIARYLISENCEKIHVLNRAQIIDDAFYFTTIGKLNASVFWNLTSYLSRETEYVAWYPMLKAIERISYIFPFPSKKGYLKTTIRKQLDALLQMIGYKEHQNESYSIQCLRQEIVKWACVVDHVTCKKEALNRLEWHLTNPLIHKLKPDWEKWTYCNGLEIGNVTVFLRIRNMYLSEILFKKDKKILEFLACSASGLPFSAKIGKSNIDNINFFHHIVAKHSKNRLDYILANWEIVKPKEISITAALIDIINHVYSKNQLDKIMEFARNINYELFTDFHCTNLESINSKIFNKLREFIRNEVAELFWAVQEKIYIRLSQIDDQMNTFVSTFGMW